MEIKRMDKRAVNECMKVLSSAMMVKNSKTEAWLYFQFEELINKTLGTSINNSDCGGIYEDGNRLFDRWHLARKDYLESLEIIKNHIDD